MYGRDCIKLRLTKRRQAGMTKTMCYLCGGWFPESGLHGWVPHTLQVHPDSLTARLILRQLAILPLATTPRPRSFPASQSKAQRDAASGGGRSTAAPTHHSSQ
jgi:hypothetical protein